MQTYDLLKFALARSNDSRFLLITQYWRNALHKQEWSDKKGRKTEKYTANVQMAWTVGVLFGLSVLFTLLRPRNNVW